LTPNACFVVCAASLIRVVPRFSLISAIVCFSFRRFLFRQKFVSVFVGLPRISSQKQTSRKSFLVRHVSTDYESGPSAKRPRSEVTPDSVLIPRVFVEGDSPFKQ
ncbi:hypothetical protein AVEN_111622-2-1, partial [Araneus ventricosus]